jgi:hypothetical protein
VTGVKGGDKIKPFFKDGPKQERNPFGIHGAQTGVQYRARFDLPLLGGLEKDFQGVFFPRNTMIGGNDFLKGGNGMAHKNHVQIRGEVFIENFPGIICGTRIGTNQDRFLPGKVTGYAGANRLQDFPQGEGIVVEWNADKEIGILQSIQVHQRRSRHVISSHSPPFLNPSAEDKKEVSISIVSYSDEKGKDKEHSRYTWLLALW